MTRDSLRADHSYSHPVFIPAAKCKLEISKVSFSAHVDDSSPELSHHEAFLNCSDCQGTYEP